MFSDKLNKNKWKSCICVFLNVRGWLRLRSILGLRTNELLSRKGGASPQKNFSSQAAGNLTRKNKKMKNLQMIDLAIRDILKKWNNPIFNYI